MADQQSPPDFGTNSWIVEEMYRDFLADPSSVAESWQDFFSDYEPAGRSSERGGATRTAPPAPAAAPAPAPAKDAPSANGKVDLPEGAQQIRGVASTIAENMNASRSMPTATSLRDVPAKLLEVNRKILNNQLGRTRGGKVSFTHLIGWALVKGLQAMPAMTSTYYESDGKGFVRRPDQVNLGLAVDVEKKDGSRTLLVPNIKGVTTMTFDEFFHGYEAVVRRIKANKLDLEMFADTTVTLTNPGTVGTVGSVPRLMPGQAAIIGVGAIDYPAEYQGADPRTLAQLGVGKVITITSTYDHRVIQGAESGLFLKMVHELLLGEHKFYDEIFDSLRIPYEPVRWRRDDHIANAPPGSAAHADKQVAVGRLINAYRVRGHLIANLNPLAHTFQRVHPELDPATYGLTIWDLDRDFATGGLAGKQRMKLGDILGILRDAYCRTIGVEYMHTQEREEKAWIQARVEGATVDLDVDDHKHILRKLNAAEAFEKFLHTKYIGQKRFSLEGAESVIPMMDAVLNAAADNGITEAVMGMAHRGRLNVLANIMSKSYEKIFREFEGDLDPDSVQGSGDVKYHLGAHGRHASPAGKEIAITLSSNPSHLEAVDPVVVGMARAKLDMHDDRNLDRNSPVLPLLIHGDAAFAGQGVVAETLALSQLRGYRTGGTIHLVINNQVGFTTGPKQARSSTYATDVAKMVQAPIFHVNGDDPEACVRVMRLALEYRQTFGKDIVVDMVCYRRWGHNEGDDPSYTQPMMYAAIENRRSVRKLYTEELVNRGVLTIEEAEQALDDFRDRLESALKETRETVTKDVTAARPPDPDGVLPTVETGVDRATLEKISVAVTSAPAGFTIHPKLAKQLEKRRAQLDADAVDWAMGEAMAFGSLVMEGTPIRLAGQDSRRGTFSQRHAVLVNYEDGSEWVPLDNLVEGPAQAAEGESGPKQARFMVYDSPLSEFACMGFEYGYSVIRRDALVLWEAQFGDFVNGAQVVIDQFIVAAEDKWRQCSGLVLLLPHGYEGQGPEHSSGRKERFLTLAAEDNIQIVEPTTAAQYFHLLRRQMHREVSKPLVVFTPKGLLRAKPAASKAEEFTSGRFREVMVESDHLDSDSVKRVLLCSGRVAFDLIAARDEREAPAAVVRVEQLYPWPQEQIREALEQFPNADEVFWVQDEPDNMGAWPFAHQRLHKLLRSDYRLKHIARPESGSPATGSGKVHDQEERQLMDAALADLD